MVCPEKKGPACEKCSFVDFGKGDWCRRPWSGLAVAGDPNSKRCTQHLALLFAYPTRGFLARKPRRARPTPADKLTRSAAARLLVSFFRVSVSLEVVSRGAHEILSTLEEDLTP